MENELYSIRLTAIPDIPLIKEGDNLGEIIFACARKNELDFQNRDVVVIASKIVSKAEGRVVSLKPIIPSEKALKIAKVSGKDARIVELMFKEAEVVDVRPGVVETRHRLGFICTSAGIDRGNTAQPEEEKVTLLPENPDQSARAIKETLERMSARRIGVIINDSLGIKGRAGSIGFAIGIAGLPATLTGSGSEADLYKRKRGVCISFADEISAAASLLMGQSTAGYPAILAGGLQYPDGNGKLTDLLC